MRRGLAQASYVTLAALLAGAPLSALAQDIPGQPRPEPGDLEAEIRAADASGHPDQREIDQQTQHAGDLSALVNASRKVRRGAEAEEEVEAPTPGDLAAEMQAADIAGSARIYLPGDFVQFAPRSALDMVRQIPGFNVDEQRGNQGRGLGQASGNVLLNGERLASKSDSISDQLQRIPADNVIRIELVDASTLDVPGLSGQVANIIAQSSEGLAVQFEWRPQLAAEFSKHRWMEGNVSVSGSTGNLDFTIAAEGRPFYGGSGGSNIFTFADGRSEERFNTNVTQGDDTRYSTSLRYGFAGGAVANVNGSLLLRRFRGWEDELVVEPGLPPALEAIFYRNKGYDYEVGGDFSFDLGPGRLTLIGLERYSRIRNRSESTYDAVTGDPLTGTLFTRLSETGERIGRFEYDWPMLGGDFQLSGEAAFNRLDRASGLFSLDEAGDYVAIPFPSGTGGVTEDRFETLLSYSRSLTGRLSLQIIAGGEYSKIQQTGSNALSRSFQRPKGSVTLSWAAADGLDISLKVDRRVGQLDFGDVLAEVNLGSDNQNAGNNNLRPDQQWRYDLEITKDFGGWGNASLRLFERQISDFVTIVPSPSGFSATGNVDSAFIRGVELVGTVRLDPLGIAGAKIDFSGALRDSGFEDPVEGGQIPVRFARPANIELDFRHDVPDTNWAWGWGFRTEDNNPYYRVEEVGFDYNIDTNLNIFVEHKDVFGLTVQARLNNIFEKEIVLDRQVFDGPRGSSPLLFRENRRREIGKVVNFVVKGSF